MTGHRHHGDDDPTQTSVQHTHLAGHLVIGYGPACYKDHDLSLWQQLREVLHELRAELRPEAIAARLDAWAERQQR